MNKKAIFKLILLILILVVIFLIIRSTYSKYVTTTDENTSLHIANWNIKLNDSDISSSKDFSNNMNLVFDENPYIDENVIAPTSTGSFSVKIESTGTELPFRYDLNITDNIDTVSKYDVNLIDYNKDTSNQTTQILFSINIDYSHRETAISDTEEIPITLTIPKGKISQVQINNSKSLSYEDGLITFIPENGQWSSDNTLTTNIKISYSELIDLLENESPIKRLSINGNIVKSKSLPDFKIISYSKNGSEPVLVNTSNATISDTVTPAVDGDGNFTGAEVINNYTFYFEWYDAEDNILDNQGDVAISKSENSNTVPNAIIPVSLKILQIEE